MADKVISLSGARKRRARAEKRAAADANAVKFGRTGAEKALDRARAEKARRDLDGHARDRDDPDRDPDRDGPA